MSDGPSLSLRGLSKTYPGAVHAVNDLSLDVAAHELVAVVGPSGCGKSTLLRLVAGLEEASAGEVWIEGARADHLSPRERDVALVFQSHSLFPHMTAFDNMAYGLRLRGVAAREVDTRVQEAAQTLGLGALLERRPAAMSGGERQRIALGRALVRRPRLLLLDEPLSSLDAHLRAELRREIVRLHRRLGAVTLLVTHDQSEALSLADRVAVLKEGTLQQVGTPAILVERPANRFVAGFIGVPAMSFFEGELHEVDGQLTFHSPALTLQAPERWRATLPAVRERAVVLGVRPEGWTVAPGAATRGEVEWVERIGDRLYAHVRLDNSVAVAVCHEPVMRGEVVALTPHPERVFFFDSHSGRALVPVTG